MEVFGSDDDGDCEGLKSKLVSEIEKRKKVTLCWVWKYQDVRLGFGHGCSIAELKEER